MPDSTLKFLVHKNLLHLVHASVGSPLFRNIYALDTKTGEVIDTMEDGQLSCAMFVSSTIARLMLIDGPHSTVHTTVKKMEEAGWYKIDEPKAGAVAHWPVGKTGHEHLGFYIGEGQYISNSYIAKAPKQHGANWRRRQPDAYYWHPKLDD